jgi:hypothetical protein
VAFVDDWHKQYINKDILQQWSDHLSLNFADKSASGQLMSKLGIDFWWDKVSSNTVKDNKGRISANSVIHLV